MGFWVFTVFLLGIVLFDQGGSTASWFSKGLIETSTTALLAVVR
jgi:hypothetical protein